MRVTIISLVFLTATWGAARAADLEVEVAGKVQDADEGRPFTITTPKGEKLELIVRRKAVIHYSGEGVEFDHVKEMATSVERSDTLTTVEASSGASPTLMIQIFPPIVTSEPAALEAEMVKGLRENFLKRGAKLLVPGKAIKRAIHGTERTGKQIVIELGKERQALELFVMKQGKRVVVLNFQYNLDDEVLARKQFAVIEKSFE